MTDIKEKTRTMDQITEILPKETVIVKENDSKPDIESQYQTVKKRTDNQTNFANVEEIIKRIVPAKSFLYRHQIKKESTPSYLPMDGSPKGKTRSEKFFRLSSYEYPMFDLKKFSKPESSDRGYYPMKRNSRFFVTKVKSEFRPKYNSISTADELKYPEDHFYEDLCYNDVEKPRSSLPATQSPKPYRIKIQELFHSFKIPFLKKHEELQEEGNVEITEKRIDINEKIIAVVEKEPVYENSDSIANMYDSVQPPVPVNQNKVKSATLPVEDYLEPVQLNKDYCDVNYRQKDDSILGYILSIFETRFPFWRETNESTEDSDHEQNEDTKSQVTKMKTNMADRPLPVPVENEPYYMNIERTEAENLLKGEPNGTFLLRPSSQSNHAYTLSVCCNNAVHNIGVRRRQDGRISLGFARRGERSFCDVTALIRYHKKRRLLLVAHGQVIGATTLDGSPQYYQTPRNLPVRA